MTRGFTLLEMLVVMVLAVTAMSVIGPRLYAGLDNIRADAEERALRELIQRVALTAYFSRREHTLEFTQGQVRATSVGLDASFDALRFPEQTVTWDANGFTATEELSYSMQGRERLLSLHES